MIKKGLQQSKMFALPAFSFILTYFLKKIPNTWKDLKDQAVTRCSSLNICWFATSVRSSACPGRAGGKNPLSCPLQKIQDSMAAPGSFKTSPIIPFLFPALTCQSLHDPSCCVWHCRERSAFAHCYFYRAGFPKCHAVTLLMNDRWSKAFSPSQGKCDTPASIPMMNFTHSLTVHRMQLLFAE